MGRKSKNRKRLLAANAQKDWTSSIRTSSSDSSCECVSRNNEANNNVEDLNEGKVETSSLLPFPKDKTTAREDPEDREDERISPPRDASLDGLLESVDAMRAEQSRLSREMESIRRDLRKMDLTLHSNGRRMIRMETEVENLQRENFRNHLLVFHVPEERNVSSKATAESLLGRLSEPTCPFTTAFRLGGKLPPAGKPRRVPRPLVIVFLSFLDKLWVKKELNARRALGPRIRASDRLTPMELESKKKLFARFLEARQSGLKAYFIRSNLFVNDTKIRDKS